MKKNEIVVKQETALAEISNGSWGAEEVTAKDIVISKLLLQQALSKFVIEGTCKSGDVVDSVTGEIYGDKNKAVEIIPITMFKTWVIEAQNGNKFDFLRIDPVTADNINANPMEAFIEEVDGKQTTCRRNLAMNFYLLVADKALQPDALPMLLMLRRTSLFAGKKIATHFTKMKMANLPPAKRTLKLIPKQQTNDMGTFWVWDVLPGRETTGDELMKAYDWYKTLALNTHKIDESDLKSDEAPAPQPSGTRTVDF